MRRLLLLTSAVALLAACGYPPVAAGQQSPVAGTEQSQPSPSGSPGQGFSFSDGAKLPLIKLPDGLQFADVKTGDGAVAEKGESVNMQYTGWLSNGTKFDSSFDHGTTGFDFTVGNGDVIKGWDEGIPGMKEGGIRRLVIPPDLGYGAQGQPPTIPANATLVFVVQLVKVTPAASPSPGASPAGSPAPSPSPS
jgi:FKBP-type peptidyl-prolyl cis-trans isomerase